MYANGTGVEQDYREAALWLDEAARQEENNTANLYVKALASYQQND